MSTVGLKKAMQVVGESCVRDGTIVLGGLDETVPRPRKDVVYAMHGEGLLKFHAGSDQCAHSEWIATARLLAALAAPRMTQAELELLTYLEEGIGTPPKYSVWRSCERNGWIEFNNGYECWDFTPAGRTALNNVRAAMGSPEYKEGL